MKKLLLSVIAMAAFVSFTNAQETKFGATAGFLSANAKVEFMGISVTDSESGFYVGAVADFGISEKFHIQPELAYASFGDGSALLLPIMAKFYVSEKFNIQAGPQLVFNLEETGDDYSSMYIDLGAGVGYDISEKFFVEARYAFQLNDAYTGDEDFSTKIGFLNIGVGYYF